MFRLRSKFNDVKQFVDNHPTFVACSVTAVVAVVVTRKIDTRIYREFIYEAGRENGVLALQNGVLFGFINENNLDDQVREYIRNITV